MNKVVLMGRLTKEPDVRYTQDQKCVARYTLAVDRRGKDAGTDFITCVTFGKNGEFAEKYLHKGTKIVVSGRIQTGSYKNKDGNTVYTTDAVVEEHDFAESKSNTSAPAEKKQTTDDFMQIPDGIEEVLPFN